ncbi:MAG: ABC transporter substrate-binding protein [Parvibaculaceae bacterium]|nr:ABC transporter substrate-binding protein [Parvibaculaceae bacterium]
MTKDKTPLDRKTVDRRSVLKTGGKLLGAAALFKAAGAVVPGGAWAAGGEGLEKMDITLGIIPLTDCAPLVVAHEKGYFARHGIKSQVSKEASWANIRDKVSIGALDAAHMLAGMPIAASLGVGAMRKPTITSYSMDLNGNAITVSNELYDRMVEADPDAMAERPVSAHALKKVIDAGKAAGEAPMTFAVVFPVSTHNYELRYWMADAGIDPDNDIRLIVIPPPQMVANLQAKNIVGYCVGEPWNERAVIAGIGKVLITNYEIWNNNPEKVVGVNLDWAEKNPNTHMAMIRALVEAAQWMDKPENRVEVVEIISQKSYVNAPVDVVKMSMTGTFRYSMEEEPRPMPDFNVFYRYGATFPWRSHAAWFISQMIRWGQIDKPIDVLKTAGEVYRPDIYREAVKGMGVPVPSIDWKTEGENAAPWMLTDATSPIGMGPDRFFNGNVFDPSQVLSYIDGFKVKNLALSMDELSKLNT